MIHALALLLVFQLAGELVVQILDIPVPGPVLGMGMLFAVLLTMGQVPDWLRDTARTLLSHLSILFVPAGVGIMLHFRRVSEEWLAIVLAVVLSTLLTVAITALSMRVLTRLTARGPRRRGHDG